MKWFVLLVAAVLAVLYADGRGMVATAASGGPTQVPMGDCQLPLPSEKAAMVFASYYEGAGTSTMRLSQSISQHDETTALDVDIVRGTRPIYLVISGSRPSVMRFSGWTKRLERVVVITGSDYPQAVTGLPRDIVTFADRQACGVPLSDLYKAQAGELAPDSAIAGVVKRPYPAPRTREEAERRAKLPPYQMPDAIGGAYDPETLTIDSGSVGAKVYGSWETRPGLPDWFKASGAADYDPAGIIAVDGDSLLSPVEAHVYAVLPGRAGMGQYLRDGKVSGSGESYTVLAPIAWPEGLYGAHSVRVTLAPGVPPPTGDPGHSTVR